MANSHQGDRTHMPKELTDHIADRWLTAKPVYLTDLGRCRPAEALSPRPKLRHWRTFEYATDCPCARATSILRSMVMICSGACPLSCN